MQRKFVVVLVFVFSLTLFLGACKQTENTGDSAQYFCTKYNAVFSLAISSHDPDLCTSEIKDEMCQRGCLTNYAWEVPDKDYCKFATNPLNQKDVSGIEECYVHIAQVTKDGNLCSEINYDLVGYGYLHYRNNESLYVLSRLSGLQIKFSAEITPKTYCYLLAVGNISECGSINVPDSLKDSCLLSFVAKDFTNPAYKGKLPFKCEDMKTTEGEAFCNALEPNVSKLVYGAIGTQ